MATAKKRNKVETSASAKKARERMRATEKHYIPNYPTKLYIFKLPASRFWWVRYFVNNNAVRKRAKQKANAKPLSLPKLFTTQSPTTSVMASTPL